MNRIALDIDASSNSIDAEITIEYKKDGDVLIKQDCDTNIITIHRKYLNGIISALYGIQKLIDAENVNKAEKDEYLKCEYNE